MRKKLIGNKSLAWYLLMTLLLKGVFVLFLTFPAADIYAGGISVEELFAATNRERRAYDLPELFYDDSLAEAAERKAKHILRYQYWSHKGPGNTVNPNFREPWDFFREVAYDYAYAGENLAIDFTTSTGVMKAWEKSSTHNKNILNPFFQDIGFAVVPGVYEGKNTVVVVQFFGARIGQLGFRASPEEVSIPELIFPPNNLRTKKQELAFVGLANGNSEIELFHYNDVFGKVAPDEDGSFFYDPKLVYEDGIHLFTAYGNDADDYSKTHSVLIDTTAPEIDKENSELFTLHKDGQDLYSLLIPVRGTPVDVIVFTRFGSFGFFRTGETDLYKINMSFPNTKAKERSYLGVIYVSDSLGNSSVEIIRLPSIANVSGTEQFDYRKAAFRIPLEVPEFLKLDLSQGDFETKMDDSALARVHFYLQRLGLDLNSKEILVLLLVSEFVLATFLIFIVVLYLRESVSLYKDKKKRKLFKHIHPFFHAMIILAIVATIVIN